MVHDISPKCFTVWFNLSSSDQQKNWIEKKRKSNLSQPIKSLSETYYEEKIQKIGGGQKEHK